MRVVRTSPMYTLKSHLVRHAGGNQNICSHSALGRKIVSEVVSLQRFIAITVISISCSYYSDLRLHDALIILKMISNEYLDSIRFFPVRLPSNQYTMQYCYLSGPFKRVVLALSTNQAAKLIVMCFREPFLHQLLQRPRFVVRV